MDKYALISVTDKTGVAELAKFLSDKGYKIISTGGTAKVLQANNINCTEVSTFTGFPEIFDGRVKTLNPKVFAGILFRRDNEADKIEQQKNNISCIDIVCVNLYKFDEVVKKDKFTEEELIENIDIGGPSLIRAAAKNSKYVSVLTNPDQYADFIQKYEKDAIDTNYRKKLACAAFSATFKYDYLISTTLEKYFQINDKRELKILSPLSGTLRYGENPHQKAELYGDFDKYFETLHGKELSYNNILDLVAGAELIEELEQNSAVIIKHNNPSGAASSSNVFEAYSKALKCDPVSAFGGIVVVNDIIDVQLALKLNEIFLELVIAPDFTSDALDILYKKKDRRIIRKKMSIKNTYHNIKGIPGGFLRQDNDYITNDFDNLKVVTKKEPTEKEIEDLKFAYIVCKNVKSNTIVFAKDKATVGIGAGQVSRIDSAKIAAMKAQEFGLQIEGSVAASDAFFPFPDGLLELVKHGAKAVIQPGGSVRDREVIEAADINNISMIFTGKRHFKH